MHLYQQYVIDLADPFILEKEIINYLSFIYEGPFKVQNTHFDYKSLNIKITKTFLVFYTYFLHLAGQA